MSLTVLYICVLLKKNNACPGKTDRVCRDCAREGRPLKYRLFFLSPKGKKVTDAVMKTLNITRYETCPQWNYTIHPRLGNTSSP